MSITAGRYTFKGPHLSPDSLEEPLRRLRYRSPVREDLGSGDSNSLLVVPAGD